MVTPLPETADRHRQALGRKPRADRRLAILADADLAYAALAALAATGYAVVGLPASAGALAAALAASDGEAVMLNDYAAFYATLPAALREAVAARWSTAEHDPQFHPGQVDCGCFTIPALRCGAVAVVAADADPADPPRHYALASLAWIADAFRADAIVVRRPPGFAGALPVLTPETGPPDLAALPAALDGDNAALRRWRLI
ncbi:MAG: cobaltochelatase subunit CobN [Alphaproteobacteria bacterium]|nr:cobaltochelatase subunit CobN [Alphaproteobacteria bacterium]